MQADENTALLTWKTLNLNIKNAGLLPEKLCSSEIIIHSNYRKQGQTQGFYGYVETAVDIWCSSWQLLMLGKPSITKWSEGKFEARKSRWGEIPPECIKSLQRVQTNPSCSAESTGTKIGFVLTSPLLKSATWQDDRVTKRKGATCKFWNVRVKTFEVGNVN